MAFSTGNKKGPVSDINVTPLVDVMLVLLVIFMVTAPLMFNGIQLNLPKTKKVHNLNLDSDQVILSISSTGELFIGDEKILPNEVSNIVLGLLKKTNTETVFIRAHEQLRYGRVAKIMSELKVAGVGNISLVTEIEQ